MDDFNKVTSDDEEDLEALRLAALQSLQKKKKQDECPNSQPWFNNCLKNKQKRGKFFNRGMRNNQFNWARNSNLISVPMITESDDNKPKLVLAQDRYNKKSDGNNEKISKFDRYDNSDESDDDDNNEKDHNSESDELKRSNSLDDLMQQLENEINNSEQNKEKPEMIEKKENVKPEEEPRKINHFKPRKWNNNKQSTNRRNYEQLVQPVQEFIPLYSQFDNYQTIYHPINGYIQAALPPIDIVIPPQPLIYDRPSKMAPLSPRSAQFVMENHAIIEKRKRKSYSRSPSPYYRPKRTSLSPKANQSNSSSPKFDKNDRNKPSMQNRLGGNETKSDDPVLEARRKKFETNEINKEGLVRLKKSTEEEVEEIAEKEQVKIDENLENDFIEDDEINLETNCLFSDDDESDSDTNEGRFKMKQQESKKIPILPFTKLVKPKMKETSASDAASAVAKKKTKRRSRTPKLATNDKKIDIKIKTPINGNEKVAVEPIKNDQKSESEGDLRAQLSRKRAERQKHPVINGVPSRLLQDALQGAVFKKTNNTNKNSKDKEETSKEGKLPIHLRLGLANMDVFTNNNKKKRKSKQV